jgi:Cytochrome b(C-terminal)/b6/petD
MHLELSEFIESICPVLVGLYALALVLDLGAIVGALSDRKIGRALVWALFAAGFGYLTYTAAIGRPALLSESFKQAVDGALSPISFTIGTFSLLGVLYLGRSFFVRGPVAWTILNGSILFLGLSLTDFDFAKIVLKGDNIPIVAMVFSLGFFTWWGTSQAVENDRRAKRLEPPVEADYSEKVLVWPDVVYLELIGLILATGLLIVWSLLVSAPLEGPANPVVTPNPSKAPWYFLGLQEMLVYFDPWIAGILLPISIIVGLLAIPYLDFNPEGNGYYTIRSRRFAYLSFQFGFLALWILLILIGTFFRGPNWSFFGLYEFQDLHKMMLMENITLSEFFWADWLGRAVPQIEPGSGFWATLTTIGLREAFGIVLLAGYFVVLPALGAMTFLRRTVVRMGVWRYSLLAFLFLLMLLLPIKMMLRWCFNLSYILSIPEYFLNV